MRAKFKAIDASVWNKTWPWYHPPDSIDSKLDQNGIELFQTCGIDKKDLNAHIANVRDQAWKIFPFPCIGEFWFIEFGLSHHARYDDVVKLLKGGKPSEGEDSGTIGSDTSIVTSLISQPDATRLLDLGTCLGQDLRMLRQSGLPSPTLYGCDLFPEFEIAGHQLFRDKKTFEGRFLAADVFDADPEAPLNKTAGLWDIITATMFLHQFDLQEQSLIAKKMIRLLRPVKGSMTIGINTGQLAAKELSVGPPFYPKGGEKKMFRHNKESMQAMWEEAVAKEGGRDDKWSISCYYDEEEIKNRAKEIEMQGKVRFFNQEEQRRIHFCIERV